MSRVGPCEAPRAERAEGPAVRGDEDQGVERADRPGPGRRERSPVGARELHERRDAGGVVARAGPGSGVVAVGHDDDLGR